MRWLSTLPLTAAAAVAAVSVTAQDWTGEYDYIVVGSGPGGGPLAANLARAGHSTLLLEAGDDQHDNPNISIIYNFNLAGNDESTRWDFFVKHSEDPAQALRYKRLTWRKPDGSFYVGLDPPEGSEQLGIYYPRAGTLGGCSQHNAGVTFLPYDDDWNVVVNMTGDTSWGAPRMRKLFERMENNRFLPRGTPGHGFDGWLRTIDTPSEFADEDNHGRDIALALADELGIPTAPGNLSATLAADINEDVPDRDRRVGFYSLVWHADEDGNRSSANNYVRATLGDAARFPLTLKLESLVTRVLFDDEDEERPTAVGVEVMEGRHMYSADPNHKRGHKGPMVRYRARKEVILSGGTFNTPQILKLSGIGPAAELHKFGIRVVKDLPGVGENMADNYETSLMSLKQGGEPLNAGGIQTLLLRTPSAPDARRNIYTWCGSFSFEGFWPGFPEEYGPEQFECAIVHMNPKSQAGYVRLRSADPQDMPEINTNFFARRADEDLGEMLEAVELLRRNIHRATGPWRELHPCAGDGRSCSAAEQKEYMREQVYSHHATSTCRIGAADDPMAVLDSKFRVRGVANLRVVDASAFPVVPGAFPVVPTMMLAEKASDDILGGGGYDELEAK